MTTNAASPAVTPATTTTDGPSGLERLGRPVAGFPASTVWPERFLVMAGARFLLASIDSTTGEPSTVREVPLPDALRWLAREFRRNPDGTIGSGFEAFLAHAADQLDAAAGVPVAPRRRMTRRDMTASIGGVR